MVSPLAVPFFRDNLHASTTMTGLVFGAISAGAVAGGVLAGPIIVRVGPRRVTIGSDVGAAVTLTGLAASPGYLVALPLAGRSASPIAFMASPNRRSCKPPWTRATSVARSGCSLRSPTLPRLSPQPYRY